MSQIEEAAAQVVLPLAKTASRVVADAFRLTVAPEEQYTESEVAIETLEFASFAVGGLSAAAELPQPGTVRSSSRVAIPLSDSAGRQDSAGLTVTLYGPGDVRGIDPAQIVRRYPAPGTLTAEETVLAHVEFDRPELPWAFSAAPAAGALRPWLTLVVVERASIQWEPATGLLPVLRVPLAQLPPLTDAHLWSHAQAPQATNPSSLEVRLSPEYAKVNLSRVLSPRVLTQDTDYVAALVPTTDVGVRGGLGLSGGTLDPAWTSASPDPVRLPVYDSWEFRTGPDGDFATLALRLQGVVAPYDVGRRLIDVSEPGRPLTSLPDGDAGGKQVLRCALYSPSPPPTPEKAAEETATWPDAMVQRLHEELDLPAQIEGTEHRTDDIPDLPILGPRIYAALHRGSAVITGDDWFAELNLSPTKRIVAGLGTRVVQRDQEPLMQAAWAQLGEVEKANRAIHLAQLAELLAQRLFTRLDGLQQGRLLQVVAPLATRVSVTDGRTLAADVADSATPAAALSGAFRRTTRPRGAMLRRSAEGARARAGELVGTDGGLRDFTRVYENPDGVGALSDASIASLDHSSVAAAISVPTDDVPAALSAASGAMRGGIATYLTEPARWQAPTAGFDLGAAVVEQWGERLLRKASVPALESIRAQRVGPLAAELATARTAAALPVRTELETRALDLNNVLVDRLDRLGGAVAGPVAGGVVVGGVAGGVAGGVVAAGPVVGNVGGHVGAHVGPHVADGIPVGLHVGEGHGFAQPAGGRPVSPALDRAAIVRGNAIGGVGRIPGGGRLPAGGGFGRVPVPGFPRLNQVDPGVLTRVDASSSAQLKAQALGNLAGLAEVRVSPLLDRMVSLPLELLRDRMELLVDPGGLLSIDKVTRRPTLTVDGLASTLEPAKTVRAALNGRLRLTDVIGASWFAKPSITPIKAAPHFDRPMYQALNDYSTDWLVPGLGLMPDDDFVTVLSTNSEFMEAFLIGLSDEMGHELLWRRYPTDERGTYFRRFWDAQQDELTQQIHAFSRTPLASHVSVGGTGGSGARAVIVVKSELVRRYPDLIVQAVRNQGTVDDPVFEKVGSPQQTAEQLFAAYLEPDIALIGVDLSIDQLDQPEWWIVVAEHPAATRFGRPEDDQLAAGQQFLTDPSVADAAGFAKKRLHDPVRVAFQATDLIVTGA